MPLHSYCNYCYILQCSSSDIIIHIVCIIKCNMPSHFLFARGSPHFWVAKKLATAGLEPTRTKSFWRTVCVGNISWAVLFVRAGLFVCAGLCAWQNL